ADALAARARRRGDALVPGLHPRRARGSERLLRLFDGASGAALPGGAPRAEDVRGGLVLDRAAEPRRRDVRAGAGARAGAVRRARAAAADAAARLRRGLSARPAVVL